MHSGFKVEELLGLINTINAMFRVVPPPSPPPPPCGEFWDILTLAPTQPILAPNGAT
jgi:hypothetical protein